MISLLQNSYTNVLPLNSISKLPKAVYFAKKINANYSGPIINVRRISDNVTRDFYSNKYNTIDINELMSFAGGGSLYIAILYDQSGYGYHLSQTIANYQPQLILSSGKIEIDFLGTRYMSRTNSPINWSTNDFTILTRASKNTATDYRGLFTNRVSSPTTEPWITFGQVSSANGGDIGAEIGGGLQYIKTGYVARNQGKVNYSLLKDSNLAIYVDNDLKVNNAITGSLGNDTHAFKLGVWYDAPQCWDGIIDGLVMYDSKLTLDEIEKVQEALM